MKTYLTSEQFDHGCMMTGNSRSWCASVDGLGSVRPGTTPGNARFVVRQHLNAKAAAVIGRDHVDLACCVDHIFTYTDGPDFTIFKLRDVDFS